MPRSGSHLSNILMAVLWLCGGCTLGRAGAADGPPLRVAEPVRASLGALQARRYRLPLAARSCALGSLRADQGSVAVRIVDARDRELRHFATTQRQPRELGWCVESAGDYEVVVTAGRSASRYELTLDAVLSRPSSPQPTAAGTPRSPRLRALQAELVHDAAAVDTFWTEIAVHGTPLVEALPGDGADLLVTFLYHADARTGSIGIKWSMWSDVFAQTAFQRMAQSDVWWLSIALPNATRLSYQLVIDPARGLRLDPALADRARTAVTRADPRNPLLMTPDPERDAYGLRSVVSLPDAPPETWLDVQPTAPRGRLEPRLLHDYPLAIYLPPGYRARHAAYPLLVVFDGETYENELRLPVLLDRLIAARRIAPLVAVLVHNRTPESRNEDLPCNARFADFVAHELLPFIQHHYKVTAAPERVGLLGASFGGLASSYIALSYPQLFGKVLSQSGSYWWSFTRADAAYDGSEEPGWLRRRFQAHARVPITFYLSAGAFEADAGHGVLEQTRLQRDALRDLGYSVAYQEFVGGHDELAWRATLPDALMALFPPGT